MSVRRMIAVLLLLAVSGSAAESLLGLLRDGAVHHETGLLAAQHATATTGEHGHEDAGAPSHEHGGSHQHGTHADHCTHQHGTAVVTAAFIFDPPARTIVTRPSEPRVHVGRSHSASFRPPRA